MSEIERCSYDTDDQLNVVVALVTERFHLNEDLAQIATEWGRDAWFYVGQTPEEEWSAELIDEALNLTLPGLDIPHGETENRPLFRVLYTAREALMEMAGERKGRLQQAYYGNKPRIIPNFEQCDRVITTLLDSFTNQYWPFNNDKTRVPQDPRHVPRRPEFQKTPEERTEEESIKLAQFWFADSYYMRGMNDSNDMTINLAALYEDHPGVFEFETAAAMEPKQIEQLLLQYHLAVQHKATSEYWVENARRMQERYDGDPRKIFENYKDFDELVGRVRNDMKGNGFWGFQKKMVSMLGYYYMYLGLVPYRNIPLPTDFHVARTAIEQEMVTFENMPSNGVVDFKQLKDFLREVFFDISEYTGISQLDICDVIWLFSGNACVNSPTNRQKLLERYKDENNKTVWVFEKPISKLEEATPKQQTAYANSCGICRLKDTCNHNVPSAEYYARGVIRWPSRKLHLESMQSSLYDADILLDAQPPVKEGSTDHEIDVRANRRGRMQHKRFGLILKLAHVALVDLTKEQAAAITELLIESSGEPGASLSGKNFSFTPNEVALAFRGRKPQDDELANLAPYMTKVA